MQPVLAMESLLIKSTNGECHADELKTVKELVFKEVLDSLERHLGVLVNAIFIWHYHKSDQYSNYLQCNEM